ncbi:MAG TPA: rhodanese-like domain-containing protein [Pyrinomonadaceae bacterium]|nr:rhodanese-like domain-containing protein [Pyrinomonadaceae bacterium]
MRRFLLLITLLISGCASEKPVAVEQSATYQAPAQATPAVQLDVAQTPKLPEVQDAIKRVFKEAAVLHPDHEPNFLAGDFNGDASEDLAVILKPAANGLSDMNQEYPPWLVRDPRSNVSPGQQLRIQKDETLLAVIHGYGKNNWRDPEATQTFVLKNVVGNDLKVQSMKEFVAANTGRKLPRPQGDLIGETLNGTPGYLYYAVSTYSWYDPKTFRPQPEAGPFHKSKTMRAHAEKPLRAHAQKPEIATISAEDLKAKMTNNDPITIVDVRGSEGYAASKTTIKGAFHFKLRRIKSRLKYAPLKDLPKDREIVTYCACPADESSITAAQTLQEAGFTRVRVLKGGWNEWLKAKGPVQPK